MEMFFNAIHFLLVGITPHIIFANGWQLYVLICVIRCLTLNMLSCVNLISQLYSIWMTCCSYRICPTVVHVTWSKY